MKAGLDLRQRDSSTTSCPGQLHSTWGNISFFIPTAMVRSASAVAAAAFVPLHAVGFWGFCSGYAPTSLNFAIDLRKASPVISKMTKSITFIYQGGMAECNITDRNGNWV